MFEPWQGAPWTPRAWQREALPPIMAAIEGERRAVCSAIMGAGKSVLIAEVVHQATREPGSRVVITTPTQALVRQLSGTLSKRCGAEKVGTFYADSKQWDREIVVCCNPSLPTLLDNLEANGQRCGLWIADEVHRTEARVTLEEAERLAPRAALGMTATPFRSDVDQRLSLWDEVVYRYSMADALRDGVLVPWRAEFWDGQGAGDVNEICLDMIRRKGEGPGVISALTIPDAEHYADYLCRNGVPARAIHSQVSSVAKDEIMAGLQSGAHAVVHVSMLAEGVDMPWLRWLCLRRPVEARVRFIQELGRVLRCYPGKTHATIMDPHGLLLAHNLDCAEALGEALEKIEREGLRPGPGAAPGTDTSPKMTPAQAIGLVEGWVRLLLLSLQTAGLAESNHVYGWAWRSKPPTEKQVLTAAKMRWVATFMPPEVRPHVERACDVAGRFRRGGASDLLSVLFAVSSARNEARAAGYRWTWPRGIIIEPAPEVAAKLLEATNGR